jgi:hypothetical protein
MNTASNTRLRLNYPSWSRPRSHYSAINPRNQQTTFRAKHTNTHSRNLHGLLPVLHRSDRWPAPVREVTPVRLMAEPVRPVAVAATQQMFQRASMTSLGPGTKTPQNTTCTEQKPYTKPSKTTPNRSRTDRQHHDPKTHELSNSPEANPTNHTGQTSQEHRSDRCNLGSLG